MSIKILKKLIRNFKINFRNKLKMILVIIVQS